MSRYVPLPDSPSWSIAAGALAMDSETAGVTEDQTLLEAAVEDAGDPLVLAGLDDGGPQITITPVEWRSAPWLGRFRYRGRDSDAFLFESRGEAEDWARERIEEERADWAALGDELQNWPAGADQL